MCVVSMMADYGKQVYNPEKINPVWWPTKEQSPQPLPAFDYNSFQQYMELLRKAAEYDKLTNQAHCESQEKIQWLKDIQEKLNSLQSVADEVATQISEIKLEVDNFLKGLETPKVDISNKDFKAQTAVPNATAFVPVTSINIDMTKYLMNKVSIASGYDVCNI